MFARNLGLTKRRNRKPGKSLKMGGGFEKKEENRSGAIL